MTDAKNAQSFFSAFKGEHKLCATKCCICHRELTDTSSIEFGIGPTCRKNYKYDDAPVVTKDSDKKELIEAIHATFPDQMANYLIKKIETTTMTPANSRELAKCTIYYASSLIDKADAVLMIQCIRVLRCLGYINLATRLLDKSYGHKLVPGPTLINDDDTTTDTFYYSGPFNKIVNEYLKTQFNGKWETSMKRWILCGDIMECTALVISATLGKLLPLPKLKIPVLKKKADDKEAEKVAPKEAEKAAPKEAEKVATKEAEMEPKKETCVTLTKIGKIICIESPFNYKFKNDVKSLLNGKWDAKLKMWKVSTDVEKDLKSLIAQHYPKLSTIEK